MTDLWILRVVVVAVSAGLAVAIRPFDLLASAAAGVVVGGLLILVESRLREASLRRLIGAGVGAAMGVVCAWLISAVLGASLGSEAAAALQAVSLVALTYIGVTVGAAKGEMLNLSALSVFRTDATTVEVRKILDTSVIIDGRIADIAEAGFMDGVLVIPQFVLWELQLVADSGDSLKRNRGRRGLDILQKIQKMKSLDVQIVETDYPHLKEVDQKLIELARELSAKIVTNDFNLNKLAQLQGVRVVNINELANALKPVVLPGEIMQVFILKEGKEYNQGVAYLDDGTMVVVDNARDQISKTIDIIVTSVLQTTAGKMIFGRFEQDGAAAQPPRSTTRRSSGTTRAYAAPRSADA